MVLSNKEIKNAIADGIIQIDPLPDLDNPEVFYNLLDTTAINLTLGDVLSIPKEGLSISFDLKQGRIIDTLQQVYKKERIPSSGYILEPRKFVLANTKEYISLNIIEGKPCYAARVEGKSSLARIGLMIHFTAPTIHAGFSGTITLELINLGLYPITLHSGMPICQLIFEPVQGEIVYKESQFQRQVTPEGVKSDSVGNGFKS